MRCELRILYCATGKVPDRALGTVAMPSLLHELIERATQRGYLDPAHDRDARLLAVMHDELAALTDAKTAFPLALPRDPSLRAVIERAPHRRGGRAGIRRIRHRNRPRMRLFVVERLHQRLPYATRHHARPHAALGEEVGVGWVLGWGLDGDCA